MNRKEFFGLLGGMSAGDLKQVQLAYWLAKNGHRMQRRDSGERYFEHPRSVAISLIEHGHRDATLMVLALLHDCVEDTNTPESVIVNLFGHEVWEGLFLLSKYIPVFDPVTGQVRGSYRKPDEVYFQELRSASVRVRLVKIGDRLHNMRSMAASWTLERQKKYALETTASIIPIAEATDPVFAAELHSLAKSVLDAKQYPSN